ncbi:hypothetical protein CRG98_003854 [Punica granatum]|uniref:Retrovirus-related Pol polyprotein from transposon TNT 1-94-like beta-barrel domain-containing protein n=1 Tax=Punica granatum TaxID=22663 RepID=A0A2I0L4S4_PUNGR|nr:hypothetical protein CRG98_003854 [Punica granatum]
MSYSALLVDVSLTQRILHIYPGVHCSYFLVKFLWLGILSLQIGIRAMVSEQVKMLGAKFELDKFDRSNNFGLWKIKMKALLVQHGLEGALKGDKKLSADLSLAEKNMVMSKALSVIQLSLLNKVLWEVCDQNSASKLWEKLESVEVPNEQVVLEAAIIPVKDESRDLRRTSITLEDVNASLNSKELQKKSKEGMKVRMANGNMCDIVGMGEVRIKLHSSSEMLLADVRHVPGLKKNLISLGTLNKLGYKYSCQGGVGKSEWKPKSLRWNSLQARDKQSEQLRPRECCELANLVVLCDAEVGNMTCRKVSFEGCTIVKLKKPDTSEKSKGGLDLSDRT